MCVFTDTVDVTLRSKKVTRLPQTNDNNNERVKNSGVKLSLTDCKFSLFTLTHRGGGKKGAGQGAFALSRANCLSHSSSAAAQGRISTSQ